MGESLLEAVEDAVERSYLGDENAAAQIAEVGHMFRASQGGDQIKSTYAAIVAYLDTHPPCDDPGDALCSKGSNIGFDAKRILKSLRSPFGADPLASAALLTHLPLVGGRRAMTAAIVLLAMNPLPASAISDAAQAYATQEAYDTFVTAAMNPLAQPLQAFPEEVQPYAAAGHILGYAMRLQAIRQGAPFYIFSPSAAWELGW